MSEVPPPTQGTEDSVHLHRREGEKLPPREHQRWYDSSRVQIAVAIGVVSLCSTFLGFGYALRDFTNTVNSSESVHTEQWAAINRNTAAISTMEDLISVVAEVHCAVYADNEQEKVQCTSNETSRRLQRIRRP